MVEPLRGKEDAQPVEFESTLRELTKDRQYNVTVPMEVIRNHPELKSLVGQRCKITIQRLCQTRPIEYQLPTNCQLPIVTIAESASSIRELALPILPQISNNEINELSEIKQGLEELTDPDWLRKLSIRVEKSYNGLGSPFYLASLAAISALLPPLPYGQGFIRSKINVLLQGPPRSGKGVIMDLVSKLCPKTVEMGTVSSAALVGSIDKYGDWTPGKAYHAKNGLLIVRELFQSFRRGEHYQDLVWDFNELVEYPHLMSKTLSSFKLAPNKMKNLREMYPDVNFVRSNEFSYEAPCAVIAGVPDMGLQQMYERITDGFLSRFILVKINYSREEAEAASNNLWKNVLPDQTSVSDNSLNLDTGNRMLKTLAITSNSDFDSTNTLSLKRVVIEGPERERLRAGTVEALLKSWDEVKRQTKNESITPPILFREQQDVLRIAIADAVSRRFAGTGTETGIVRVDERAVLTGLRYLSVIVEISIRMHVEALRLENGALRTNSKPMALWNEYEMVVCSGSAGTSDKQFEHGCADFGLNVEKALQRLKILLDKGEVYRDTNNNIIASIYKHAPTHVGTQDAWD
ncbi:MAG: hypothetical protein ACLPY5_03355 [Candidatus Bathyarchaeia archaeon]